MADPVIYGPAYSTYARSARLALEEKGVPYRLSEIDIFHGMPAEQLARHPFGKVPAFEHDGFQLYETGAIERYVDESFGGPKLQPDTPRARARMVQIISIIDSYTYGPMIGQLVIQRLVTPLLGGTADEAVIEGALPAVRKAVGVLENLLGSQTYFTGETLSLADLHVAPCFSYLVQTPESGSILEDKPNLRRWWENMRVRESMKKTEPKLG